MSLPAHSPYVIVGAGVHGLSTAWHLASELRERGRGDGSDILVIDKTAIAAGASGIACGVIRNNYFQPAMRELMAHSVSVWESDPAAFSYHPVGYIQVSPESMRSDVATIAEQQAAIGYESEFIEGEEASRDYMRELFDDWRAPGTTSILHEKRGGYANNVDSIQGLADKARAEGVHIETGISVTGFRRSGEAITAVDTDHGPIETEQVVIGVGPWVKHIWDMLELPSHITVRQPDGTPHENVRMWTYWSLQEGTLGVDPEVQRTNAGEAPPVIHVDSDQPLYADDDGALITDKMWGIYYKPDLNFGGIQGGAAPVPVDRDPEDVRVDPYGPDSPDFVMGEAFARMWTSALAFCQARFSGRLKDYKREPSGGIGCFTPDNFPVFDTFRDNCYIIADSNHGYKMIGLGALVAQELMGETSSLLEPFRFERYEKGELHPTSNSPFPWS